MIENEQLNDREMAMLMTIFGNKPTLRNKVLELLMSNVLLDNSGPNAVHLMDESSAEPVQIIQNAIECNSCGTILNSTHRHDFDVCLCGNAVDGGLEYIRRVGDPVNITDLTITTDTPREIVFQRLLWGTRGINGDQPLVFKRVINLETSHLEAILNTQKNASLLIRAAIHDILTIRKNGTLQ